MPLASLEFSDLILLPTGQAVLKGLPGLDRRLQPVSKEDEEEASIIREALSSDKFRNKVTFRYKHRGRNYRVARYNDIEQGPTLFLRRLPEIVPDIQDLGLVDDVLDWLLSEKQQRGLVLLIGPQASGKTTCAASFIAARLRLFGGHAVSFEIPVEMPLAGPHGEYGWCFQEELESEDELAGHIERSHRYASPNLIYVGEIRGKHAASETLRVALGSAEQIVITTLHGQDIVTAMDRLIGWAREIDGNMAAQNLAHSLLAVIHLELATIDGEKMLRMPEFLLFPFSERAKGMRAKIRDMKWSGLENDIMEQCNIARVRGLKDL